MKKGIGYREGNGIRYKSSLSTFGPDSLYPVVSLS
jgi:hypothetical protein